MIARSKLIGISIVVLAASALGAGVYFRLNGEAEGETPEGETTSTEGVAVSATDAFSTDAPIPVEGAAAVRDTLVMRVEANGQAAADRTTVLRALVEGPVAGVPVRENAAVGEGATLVEVDPLTYRLDLAEAEARLETARNQMREITLLDDRIEDPAIRAERERFARAKSGLDQAEIAVERAQLNLSRSQVKAPFGGRAANIKVVNGAYVRTGDELMTIVDIDPIRLEVDVLESEVGHLIPGGGAEVTFSALPGVVFTGRIATINPIVEEATRTARVTVMVPNPQGRILPGMYARVSLEAQRFANRLLVPKEAVLERDDRRTLLFVFQPDSPGSDVGIAEWRYVSLGLDNGRLVEIVENPDDPSAKLVEPGEIVLVDGHYTMTHAARVRLTANAAAEGGRPR